MKNYERIDHLIGIQLLQKLDESFRECEQEAINGLRPEYNEAEARKIARRYLLAELIEMFGKWSREGDCFPNGIQLGQGSKKSASIVLEKLK